MFYFGLPRAWYDGLFLWVVVVHPRSRAQIRPEKLGTYRPEPLNQTSAHVNMPLSVVNRYSQQPWLFVVTSNVHVSAAANG